MFLVKIELEILWLLFLKCYILNQWDMKVFLLKY